MKCSCGCEKGKNIECDFCLNSSINYRIFYLTQTYKINCAGVKKMIKRGIMEFNTSIFFNEKGEVFFEKINKNFYIDDVSVYRNGKIMCYETEKKIIINDIDETGTAIYDKPEKISYEKKWSKYEENEYFFLYEISKNIENDSVCHVSEKHDFKKNVDLVIVFNKELKIGDEIYIKIKIKNDE